MADINTNINVGIDTSGALANLKALQRQISQFQTALSKGSATQAAAAASMQRDLINNINATGKFSAGIQNVTSTTESFTNALERNKLSMGQYFRYAGGASKTFGRLFTSEFNTIEKVARERVKTLQTQYIKLGRNVNGAMRSISVRPLALDMENLATKTAIAAQKQALFNQLMNQGSTNLLNFGKNTQWAGRQLMVGFTVPLTYLGVMAGKTFMQMEEQAIRFKRVYGDSFTASSETDKMLDQLKDLGQGFTKYGVAVEKTMGIAADAAAMGKQGADLIAQVSEATRLSVLGGVEQAQALETTISLTNAFAVASENLANKIDFLNAVENQTVTSIEDLTIAIPKAGPVVQQLGGDVEDLAFFLTAMKEGGINASEGANALKSGLASLINPAEKSAKFLEGFGINIKGIVEANKGDVKGLVLDFAEALDTLDPLSKARSIEQLFGKFQFARLSTLFQNVIQEGSQAQRVLELTNASTAELAILSERELKRVEDSPMFKFKKALEDIKVSLVPLGEAFLKAVTPLVQFGADVLKKFNELDEGAKSFLVGLTGLVGLVGPVALMAFGLLANGVANIIKLFNTMRGIFGGVSKSSEQLGMSTQYMTQEQLEAAAVAASLDQTHSKLIQTFSSESKTIDSLTQAYNRAIQAQQRYNVGAGVRTNTTGRPSTPPKKYASGVVSVPGPKGAGDIVPAMLSPGEAVIPARQSAKYSGLIQGMIDDTIPGYRIGLNPFAAMLKNSRVSTRMRSDDLKSMLGSGDTRYKSAFETGTGDDYINNITGQRKTKQEFLRRDMETDVLGLPRDMDSRMRPTYGSVEMTPFGRMLSGLFGLRGKQFRTATSPGNEYLERYGDVDLVGKRSLNKRSSILAGDALKQYAGSQAHYGMRRRKGEAGNFLPPMVGASSEQLDKSGRFWQFNSPFGQGVPTGGNSFISNPGVPYVEAQVAGGFDLKEVSKIRVTSKGEAKQLQKLVDQAGLRIKVTPRNATPVIKLLANMFGSRFAAGTAKVPGYNNGVVSVPGPKGKGDVSPAMLTPGEAIIPADMATKYRDLIAAMIDDKIPGFSRGVKKFPVVSSKSVSANARAEGKGFGTVPVSHTQNVSNQGGALDLMTLDPSLTNLSSIMAQPIMEQLASNPDKNQRATRAELDRQIEKWKTANAEKISNVTRLINEKTSPNEVFKDKKIQAELRSLERSFEQESKKPGSALSKLKQAANSIYDKSVKELEEVKKTVTKKKIDLRDKSGKGATALGAALPNNSVAEQLVTPGKNRGYQKNSRVMGSFLSMFGGATADTGIPAMFLDESQRTKGTTASRVTMSQEHLVTNEKMAAAREANLVTQGKNDKEEKKTVTSRSKVAKTETANAKEASRTEKARAKNLKVEARSLSAQKGWETRRANRVAAETQAMERAAARSDAARRGAETRRRNKEAALAAPVTAPGATAGGRAGAMLGRAGGIAGGASMAAMGLSMVGGDIGAAASQAIMPLMALGMVLPMLANPVGLVVAGLAAAVGGFIYLNTRLNDATKAGLALGEAMSMGSSKLEAMATVTGQVTASQIADKEREMALAGRAGVDRKFGQEFIESESGKGLLQDAQNMIDQGMDTTQLANNFATQLSYAIAQGAVTPEQARGIAAGLGNELQNYELSINVMGQLTSLFGRDGENLLNGDPLNITLKIQESSMKQQTELFENSVAIAAENSSNDWVANTGNTILAATAALTVGSAMTGIGAVAAPFIAAIGGIVGTAFAVTGNLMDQGDQEENNKARAVAVQYGAEQISQNQGLLDSLDRQYDQQIATLNAEKQKLETQKLSAKGKKEIAEIDAKISAKNTEIANKEQQKVDGINAQKAANAQVFEQLIKQSQLMGGAFNDAIGLSIDERFKDATGALKSSVDLAKGSLSGMTDSTFKATLQIGLASGEIDPNVITSLINANKENGGQIETTFNTLVKTQGTAEANQVMQLLLAGGVKTENIDVMLNTFASSTDFAGDLAALEQITGLAGAYGITVDLNVNGEDKIKAVSNFMAETKDMPEVLTYDVITKFADEAKNPATKATLMDIVKNFDELAGKDKKLNYQVIVDYATGKMDSAAILGLYLASDEGKNALSGLNSKGLPEHAKNLQKQSLTDNALSWFFKETDKPADKPKDPKDDPADTTKTKKADPLEDMLKRLKAVRNATTNVSGGFAELNRVLRKGLGIEIFKGTNQKLMQAGYDKEFIDWLDGLDEATRKRFVTVKNGVVKVTEEGKRAQQALREIRLGDFQESLVQETQELNNQAKAYDRLTKAGLGSEAAWELIQDGALASSIAIAATDREVTDLINTIKKNDDLEIKVKLKTPQGLKSLADEQLGAIAEVFAAREAEVNRKFAQDTQYLTSANGRIAKAQNEIIASQDLIDDLQYDLDSIAKKEDEVNKKYDKRQEALDKIFEANKDISDQQAQNVDIAQALASGDIAAAARAVQAKRKADAERAKQRQQDGLERARQKELGAITSTNNKTRAQIEKEILDNQEKIAKIEEERLEPAQKLLREAERLRDVALEAIGTNGYLGKTKAEWEAVTSSIRLASVEAAGYGKAITDALLNIPGFSLVNGKLSFNATAFGTAVGNAYAGTPAGNPGGQGGNADSADGGSADTAAGAPTKAPNPNQARINGINGEIKTLNADIETTRERVRSGNYRDAAHKTALMKLNEERINEVRRLEAVLAQLTSSRGGGGGGTPQQFLAAGGMVKYMSLGGMAQYKAAGGSMFSPRGTDTVPAMLTPGEFVMQRYAVDKYGVDTMKSINNGTFSGDSVYNYNLNVSVKSGANPDDIASAVMSRIKQIDSQRIRSNRY